MLTDELNVQKLFHYFVSPAYSAYHTDLNQFNCQKIKSGHPLMSISGALGRNMVRTSALAWLPFVLTGTPQPGGGRSLMSNSLDGHFDEMKVHDGLETLLASIAINSWTTFESLAVDLWRTALNLRPETLARNVAGSKNRGTAGIEPGKTIQFDEVARYGFDVRERMGDILSDKFVFTRLDQLKKAYAAAFGDDSPITHIACDPCLYTASQVRHLLVHRGGIIDAEFLSKTKSDPLMSAACLNASLPLTGDIACVLVDNTTRFATQLLYAVHHWLESTPA